MSDSEIRQPVVTELMEILIAEDNRATTWPWLEYWSYIIRKRYTSLDLISIAQGLLLARAETIKYLPFDQLRPWKDKNIDSIFWNEDHRGKRDLCAAFPTVRGIKSKLL